MPGTIDCKESDCSLRFAGPKRTIRACGTYWEDGSKAFHGFPGSDKVNFRRGCGPQHIPCLKARCPEAGMTHSVRTSMQGAECENKSQGHSCLRTR